MEDSIWTTTLAGFREKVGGVDPVPAGVAVSAVTASLALALLAKVLDITGKRKNFKGDRRHLSALLEAASTESKLLTQFADDDVAAFNQYMDCKRQGTELTGATRNAIEVPMNAARACVQGMNICAEAAAIAEGLTAADIGAASQLLSGAMRAMLLSVDFNVREMSSDEQFSDAITAGRRKLELEALRIGDEVSSRLGTLLKK